MRRRRIVGAAADAGVEFGQEVVRVDRFVTAFRRVRFELLRCSGLLFVSDAVSVAVAVAVIVRDRYGRPAVAVATVVLNLKRPSTSTFGWRQTPTRRVILIINIEPKTYILKKQVIAHEFC